MKMRDLEIGISLYYKKYKEKEYELSDLVRLKSVFKEYATKILEDKKEFDTGALRDCLMCALNVYSYSQSGEVLMSDREYDMLHVLYQSKTGEILLYPDNNDIEENVFTEIVGKKWNTAVHKQTNIVGNIKKVYSKNDLIQEINKIKNSLRYSKSEIKSFQLSPKFDGVSASLYFENGELKEAITRGDGYKGQLITPLVKNIPNLYFISRDYTGYIKVEICMSRTDFERMIKDGGKYANRRSATSAAINTPTNIYLADYLTIIPLYFYENDKKIVAKETFDNKGQRILFGNFIDRDFDIKDFTELEKVFFENRNQFEFRTDGLVITPIIKNHDKEIDKLLEEDLMVLSIAYKINTNSAITRIKRAYLSMGRTGKAIPMIEVEPCEVNETEVTNISLGSFPKFYSYVLRENQTVKVISAGDVIPQLDSTYEGSYEVGSKKLFIDLKCPYCGMELIDYKCTNNYCMRINTGRITNFLKVMKVDNISDATIESLYNAKLINTISDLFTLKEEDIMKLDGFSNISAHNICRRINDLMNDNIEYGKLFGALGIDGISEKLATLILDTYTAEDILDSVSNNLRFEDAIEDIASLPSFGINRAETFMKFILENRAEIKRIMSYLNMVQNKQYYGNVVFSGFRDEEWVKKFDDIDLRYSDTINNHTLLLITANPNSSKVKKASKRNIMLYHVSEIDIAYEDIKERIRKHDNALTPEEF